MSEQPTEAVAATETPEAPTTETPTPAPESAETVEHWREIARKQEKRAKENADAAKRLAEIEDAQKTEQQRIAERQAQAERERDEARAEGLRYKAAATHGISEDYFDLLGVGDEEAIGARAAQIGTLIAAQRENEQLKAELEALKAGAPGPVSGRPVESLRPGATPELVTPTGVTDYPSHWFPKARGDSSSSTGA